MALLSQAAEGQTYTELSDGLHLNGADKATVANQFHTLAGQLQKNIGDAQFTMANRIYVQRGHKLNKNFQNVATTKFESGVENLNFGDAVKSAEMINRFVAEKTNGKIKELVKSDSLSTDTLVFLVNAIYFKGNWKLPFNKKFTRKAPFHTSNNQTISTDFMVSSFFCAFEEIYSKSLILFPCFFLKKKVLTNWLNYAYSDELKAEFVELKYADSQFSFVVAKPSSKSNLQQLEMKIKGSKLGDIFNEMEPQVIQLNLPKFKVEYEIELNEVLKQVS